MPTAGTITFDGTDITDPKVNIDAMRRQMGMVFQHFNLFPNMTVLQATSPLAPVQTKLMSQSRGRCGGRHKLLGACRPGRPR